MLYNQVIGMWGPVDMVLGGEVLSLAGVWMVSQHNFKVIRRKHKIRLMTGNSWEMRTKIGYLSGMYDYESKFGVNCPSSNYISDCNLTPLAELLNSITLSQESSQDARSTKFEGEL